MRSNLCSVSQASEIYRAYRKGKFAELNLWVYGIKISRYFLVFTEFSASKIDLKKASQI